MREDEASPRTSILPGLASRRSALRGTFSVAPAGAAQRRYSAAMPHRQAELDRLRSLQAQIVRTEALIAASVADARRKGITWEQIGEALGVSKQAAQQKFVKEP